VAKYYTRRYTRFSTKQFDGLTEFQRKFINMLMCDGKKTVARKIFEDAKAIIEKKEKLKFGEVFEAAMHNTSPVMEVRSKRVAGASYQVPFEVKENRRKMLAAQWMIGFARKKKGPMAKKLAAELLSAANGEGEAVKKKDEMHRMAEANRAFAHFARYA